MLYESEAWCLGQNDKGFLQGAEVAMVSEQDDKRSNADVRLVRSNTVIIK